MWFFSIPTLVRKWPNLHKAWRWSYDNFPRSSCRKKTTGFSRRETGKPDQPNHPGISWTSQMNDNRPAGDGSAISFSSTHFATAAFSLHRNLSPRQPQVSVATVCVCSKGGVYQKNQQGLSHFLSRAILPLLNLPIFFQVRLLTEPPGRRTDRAYFILTAGPV